MNTAASSPSRAGRGYWAMVVLALVIVLVITSYSVGWLTSVLSSPADPGLSAGEQAGLDLAARVALVDWMIRIGILAILVMIAFLARKWMLTIERQAAVAEAQLVAARDQLQLTQAQLGLNQEAAAKQADLAEMNLRSDRFSRAIIQATSGSSALRAVGLLALEELAIEYEGQFATSIYEFLIALIKEKATPDADQRLMLESVAAPGERSLDQIPVLDADADAALAILGRNRELFDRNIDYLQADTAEHGGTGLHLVDVDLSGIWLRGANLTGATLTNVRLGGAVIVDVILADAVISNSRASDTTFDDVDLSRARFHSSTFAESTFTETKFERALISASDFGAAAITKTSFKRANATGTGFVGAVFTDSSFDEALLTGTSFHGALFTNLGGATTTFTKSTLSSVAFNDATFAGTGFANAAVNDADFTNARLNDVTFTAANMRQTNFSSASLDTVDFDGAELFDVRFEGATLVNTLTGAITPLTGPAPVAQPVEATAVDPQPVDPAAPATVNQPVEAQPADPQPADTAATDGQSIDPVATNAHPAAATPATDTPAGDAQPAAEGHATAEVAEPSNVIHLEIVPDPGLGEPNGDGLHH